VNYFRFLLLLAFFTGFSQTENKAILDSIFIDQVENQENKKPKVLHAEPLYIDLIRDLGARKGEREWNVGYGINDDTNFNRYEALVEYEWAPIDRLGLEIETPFSFFQTRENANSSQTPESRLDGLQLAAQYTFLVDPKRNISLAGGYLHEFSFNSFRNYGRERFFTGNVYSPFFVGAKRIGSNFHTLIYTGPIWEVGRGDFENEFAFQINTNFHYMITGTRNFLGIEVNQVYFENQMETIIRPQMRLEISEKLMIGIVAGIPIQTEFRRFSTFFRLIYEPSFLE